MGCFEIDGRERFVRTRGASDLPPAVFLHPFMLNSRFWWDQLEGLSDIRFCLAPDLPGFGRSDPLRIDRIDLGEYANDLLRCLDTWGIDGPVDLVGLSGSAIVAVLAAALAPERIRSLALMSAPFIETMGEAYDRYKAEMARLVVVEDKSVVYRRMLDYVVGPGLGLTARARYRSMFEETRAEMFVAFLTQTSVRLPEDLSTRLAMPVLFPVGEHDTLISPEAAQAQAGTLANARIERIDSCGRFPPIEQPDRLNAALRRFWSIDP
jgi:pimeloyl-ACP methyl ester carboxylesterase